MGLMHRFKFSNIAEKPINKCGKMKSVSAKTSQVGKMLQSARGRQTVRRSPFA